MNAFTAHLRRLFLAVAVAVAIVIAAAPRVATGNAPLQQPDADARLERVEQWLGAIVRHEPGATDEAAVRVASWSTSEIRTLWIDANAIVQLMRDPQRSRFSMKPESQGTTQVIRYSTLQLARLKTLACAAAGILTHPVCAAMRAATHLDADLARLSSLAAAARLAGDDNFILRRGALLHADIAMLLPSTAEPLGPIGAAGPQRVRIQTSDGVALTLSQIAPHWELGRALLDYVTPPGAANPAPAMDDMVRLWYRATAAWMQAREQHDTDHLDRARAIFPNDADLLFLSACQHEVYAGPQVQSALRSAPTPTGMRSDVVSDRSELRRAEAFFRRALAANPGLAEAHLRFGRVLFLLERHADAVAELRTAIASADDDQLRYYGELFLGAAEAARGDAEGARDAYARAARLYPSAQSPRLALSELAGRRGDRGGALREMQRVFDLPGTDLERDDPWWRYYVIQARNADELLEALRKPFRGER